MRDRHDLHIAAGTTSTIATIFSAGPSGVIGFFLLAGVGGLGLYALAEPGIAIAVTCVAILPIAALLVGRVRTEGRLDPARLVLAATMLGVAVFAYQAQWGTLGASIDEAAAKRCVRHDLRSLPIRRETTDWFMGCRNHLTRDERGIACRQLLYWGETKTIRLTLVCE